jgi:hypothetical protein
MIHPTSADLLNGVEAALRKTVLPELPRGTAARKQMQAALEILRHVAHALPAEAATLMADNADMAEVLTKAGVVVPEKADPVDQNLALQQAIADLQAGEQRTQITPLIVALHKSMTVRALALIPPPKSRP